MGLRLALRLGPAHVSRESINVIGCEARGEAVFGHQFPESVALVKPAFTFLKDFTLQCVCILVRYICRCS